MIPTAVLGTTAVTTFTYDLAGRLVTLTDPIGNTTTWSYDTVNRVTSESIVVDSATLTRSYAYDDNSNLTSIIDRLGRVTKYDYDHLNRLKTKSWFADVEDETPDREIEFTYDAASNLLSVSDPDAEYEFLYDNLSRLTEVSQTIAGLMPTIQFVHLYDAVGRMNSSSATIDSTSDYVNTYAYDALGRLTSLIQADQNDNAVAAKRVDMTYNGDSQLTTIALCGHDHLQSGRVECVSLRPPGPDHANRSCRNCRGQYLCGDASVCVRRRRSPDLLRQPDRQRRDRVRLRSLEPAYFGG